MKLTKIFPLIIVILAGLSMAHQIKAAPPSPITDLKCVFSQMPGAVWLAWSVPAGNPTGYDVRYSLGTIDAANFNSSWQFSQSWSGSTTQGLVDSLAEEKLWFFAMKAINGDGASVMSNIAYCYVPKKVAFLDKTPPTSLITDPETGTNILAGKDYIIKGISSDTGGSSVQGVEISLDGGNTWEGVKSKESIETGFSWEYLWSKPITGSHLIKTRATDWWNNVETPREGTEVIVVTELPPEEKKPIEEMNIEELKAKIVEIQQKIIELLTQLINLLQSQIKGYSA